MSFSPRIVFNTRLATNSPVEAGVHSGQRSPTVSLFIKLFKEVVSQVMLCSIQRNIRYEFIGPLLLKLGLNPKNSYLIP